MLEKARSENPLPVMVISSPPVVQPVVCESVTSRGLDWMMDFESSSSDGELNIGENATASNRIDTMHARISVRRIEMWKYLLSYSFH